MIRLEVQDVLKVIAQKNEVSIKDFFSKCEQICRKLLQKDLVTFTENNRKLHFCAVRVLNFWTNLSLNVLIKPGCYKKTCRH